MVCSFLHEKEGDGMPKTVHTRESLQATFRKIKEELNILEEALVPVISENHVTNEQYLNARSPLTGIEQWIGEMRYHLNLQQTIENGSTVALIMARLVEIADILDVVEVEETDLREAAMNIIRKVTHEKPE